MDSVMDFVNISFIYHAIQKEQQSHYQMINDLKRKNVRDVRDKKRKKLIRAYTEKCVRKYKNYLSTPYVIHTSDLAEKDGIVYLPLYMTPLL